MPPNITILLPPSEGKAPGGTGPPWEPGRGALPGLDRARARVVRAAGRAVRESPTLPAIERYTGVLYKELAYATLPTATRRRIDRSVLIASGLLGVVALRDPGPRPPAQDVGVAPEARQRLSTWWRPQLTAALAERLAGAVVWDLLPAEHAAAWSPEVIAVRRRITVRFADVNGATVAHWNKLLKGALVRHVLDHAHHRPPRPRRLGAPLRVPPRPEALRPHRARRDGRPRRAAIAAALEVFGYFRSSTMVAQASSDTASLPAGVAAVGVAGAPGSCRRPARAHRCRRPGSRARRACAPTARRAARGRSSSVRRTCGQDTTPKHCGRRLGRDCSLRTRRHYFPVTFQ